jgi:hypothetical protein
LWKRMNAHCRPAIIRFSSFRGSAMIAVFVPSLVRGRSSKIPPVAMRSFAWSTESYSSGLATGPAP